MKAFEFELETPNGDCQKIGWVYYEQWFTEHNILVVYVWTIGVKKPIFCTCHLFNSFIW